ncbi:MAG: hypothetical protein NXH70_02620 [Hyphomonas sp.]|nr:hypothetical protein [Hyphomonas sp.]
MQLSEYESGTSVSVSVTVPTLPTGATITAISYSLFDNDGAALVTGQAVPTGDVSNGVLPITIASAHNTLATSPSKEIRQVTVSFTDSNSDVYAAEARYIVRAGEKLIKLANSFGTLNELYLAKSDMSFLTELDAITTETFQANAIEAWRRLSRLNFRYKIIDSNADQLSYLQQRRDGYVYIKDITLITQSEYDGIPAKMQTALMRAQLVEAAQLVAGDPLEDRREAGIVSETVGESKMFFNNRPPLKFPVSRKTLKEIEGYFYWDNRIARA